MGTLMSTRLRTNLMRLLLGMVLSLVTLSCDQYDYASPLPGILEVRLSVKNNRQGDLLPFSPVNQFAFILKELRATQPGDIRLPVYPDTYAIRRNLDGDRFNCLDTLARDSALILGATYAPPESFTGIEMFTELAPYQNQFGGANYPYAVVISSSFFPSVIEVVQPLPPPPAFRRLPRPGEALNIQVNEGRLTRVTITLDLDSTLVRRTEFFLGNLVFYVSSVQNF